MRVSSKSVQQECPGRVSRKEYQVRVSGKECQAREIFQECRASCCCSLMTVVISKKRRQVSLCSFLRSFLCTLLCISDCIRVRGFYHFLIFHRVRQCDCSRHARKGEREEELYKPETKKQKKWQDHKSKQTKITPSCRRYSQIAAKEEKKGSFWGGSLVSCLFRWWWWVWCGLVWFLGRLGCLDDRP